MRKLIAISIVISSALATSAIAGPGGVNLSWDNCSTSAASGDKEYACNGTLGQVVSIQGSFLSPVSIPDLAGTTSTLDFSWPGVVPDYWRIFVGDCNTGALVGINPVAAPPCVVPNIFDPEFSGGGFEASYPSPDRLRIAMDWASGASVAPSVAAGMRYPAFKLVFDPDQGVHNGCSGCGTPGSFLLVSIELFGFSTGEDYLITSADVRNTITWQAGPTPARNKTWGAIKALYR